MRHRAMKMRGAATLAALALAVVAAGCGGGDEGEQEGAAAPGGTARAEGAAPGESAGAGATRPERGTNPPRPDTAPTGDESITSFGSEAEGDERERLIAAQQGLLNGLADRDYATACTRLSERTRRGMAQLTGRRRASCESLLPKLLSPTAAAVAREQAGGDVASVRVEAEQAFVLFRAPGAKLYMLAMREEDGEWRSTTVAGSVVIPDL